MHDQELGFLMQFREFDLDQNFSSESREHFSLTPRIWTWVLLHSHQESVWAAGEKTDALGLLKELNLLFYLSLCLDLGPVGRLEQGIPPDHFVLLDQIVSPWIVNTSIQPGNDKF